MRPRLLEGKVVLVAGAASGIGRAAALTMAAAGARVGAAGLRLADCEAVTAEIADAGGAALPLQLDVRSRAEAGAAVDALLAAYGRLDTVFTPAGILRQASVADVSAEDWDEVVAVHGGGHANLFAAAIPVMRRQGGGRLIAVSSGAAIDGIGELAAYATAKAAILGMTRALAAALEGDGIAVNAISPTAYTPMSRDVPPGEESPIPARYRRRGAEEVAAFLAYLASDRAAGVSGRLFMVSGGHTIEFDPPRPLKQMQLAAGADVAALAEELAWVQRRPTSLSIGRRPTRDYWLLPERPGAALPDPTAPLRPAGRIVLDGAPAAVAGALAALGLAPAGDGELLGAMLFPGPLAGAGDTAPDVAWAAVAPLLRKTFLALKGLVPRRPQAVVVVLPPYAGRERDLAVAMLSTGLLGLARSAASALAGAGIAVQAVHAPAAGDEAAFARLAAALLRSPVAAPGGLFAAAGSHVASFVPEMPAWQHFGEQALTEDWLAAVAAVVASRGRAWPDAA